MKIQDKYNRAVRALKFIAGEYKTDTHYFYGNPNICGPDGCDCDSLFADDIIYERKLPKGLEEIISTDPKIN